MAKQVIRSNLSKLSKRHQRIARALPDVYEKSYAQIADESIVLYQKTTRTWKRKPRFYGRRTPRGVTINTNSWLYRLIDFGSSRTGKYPIVPRHAKALHFFTPYKAATKPRVIASYNARYGNQEHFRRKVMHPYMQARHFTDEIVKRMQKRAAGILRKQLGQATFGEGTGL